MQLRIVKVTFALKKKKEKRPAIIKAEYILHAIISKMESSCFVQIVFFINLRHIRILTEYYPNE